MGSPEDEEERYDNEGPQHRVTVPAFFIGKYEVTQAQWHAVAGLPKIERNLDPDPSLFKGANRPVQNVSWYDAVEFCQRLAQHSGCPYRLPSEAEWEYACRANTTTPFHFGQTLTTEVANYNGIYTYGGGPRGKYQEQTTEVDRFSCANDFGLYDMHGNVGEWCQDFYHESYEGAPTDGSAWTKGGELRRILRGGSWVNAPWDCRSAYRHRNCSAYATYYQSFRVCCSAPKT